MPRLKKYPIFISHAWDHSSDYDRLIKLLKDAKRFECRNSSVPKTRKLDTRTDRQLERALRRQIAPAHSVLIIAGMYVKHRKWIQTEIDIAMGMHKNIIIVKPRGAQKMPRELQGFPQHVGWDTNNIIRSIRNPISISPECLSQIEQSELGETENATTSWQEEIASSPDFSALQDWLDNPETPAASPFMARRKILEKRRGVSG